MCDLLFIVPLTVVALLGGTVVLHGLANLGKVGRRCSDAMARAPLLDLMITYFVIAPLVLGLTVGGGLGLAAAAIGQCLTVLIWTVLHAWSHPAARRGPRILKVLNRVVGPWRNYAAVWITVVVAPLFWVIRMAQILLYPLLVWLVRFPRYEQGDWVNVSRQKFDGLVGHDLIWCLYCDWMTGVWSLGSEMLRNVESFWCPIRFDDHKKCENCRVDFPDVEKEWVPAKASMAEVAHLLESKYTGAVNAWYGHKTRLTMNGNHLESDGSQPPAGAPNTS